MVQFGIRCMSGKIEKLAMILSRGVRKKNTRQLC